MYKLVLQDKNDLRVESLKVSMIEDNLKCWEILFVDSCRSMLDRIAIEVSEILKEGQWRINFNTSATIDRILFTLGNLNRFMRSTDVYLADVFLVEPGDENHQRMTIMIA
jgi:hypothetical protein